MPPNPKIELQRDIFVVYTNTDLTEGRGEEYPLYVCQYESTAIRKGKKAYVQGSDCAVRAMTAYKIDNIWYGPIRLWGSTKEDDVEQMKINIEKERKRKLDELSERMKTAGFSDYDIRMLYEK